MLTSLLDQLRSQLPQSRPFAGRRAAFGANSFEPDSLDREPTDIASVQDGPYGETFAS
jgi:hypothetical protein